MFRATFAFSMQNHVCGLEIDAVGNSDNQARSVELTFRVKESEDAPFKAIHVGRLAGYSAWSEAPLALLLRSIHLLRVQGGSSIPKVLLKHQVRDLAVTVIHLTRNGLNGTELAAFTLKKVGYEDNYTLVQSLPNRSLFPMSIDADSAVPLGAALKAVAQVQLESVDLHALPMPVQVTALTDDNRRRHVLREQIPYFALAAFDVFSTAFASSREGSAADLRCESTIPADVWANFLAA